MLRLLLVAAAILCLGVEGFPANKANTQDKTHTAQGTLYEFSDTDLAYEGDFKLQQDAGKKFLRLDVGNTTSQVSRAWRYTGIYTADAYYEMGPQVRNAQGQIVRFLPGKALCQKYTNWTYNDIAATYSTNKGLNYMGQVNVKNDYAVNGVDFDAYIGAVQRHPLHLDLTQQWIDATGPAAGLRRGGLNAMPGGWWMIYSTTLSSAAPPASAMDLPPACKCPVRIIPNNNTPRPAGCPPIPGSTASKVQTLGVNDEEIDVNSLPLNWDFTTHHFSPNDRDKGVDKTRQRHMQQRLNAWSEHGHLPHQLKRLRALEANNEPQTQTVDIDNQAHYDPTKQRVAVTQARAGFRPYLKRVTTSGTGTEKTYTGGTQMTKNVGIGHYEDVAKKIYRIEVMNANSVVNETFITTASGAFYAFSDGSGKRKCEYTSTFNYDDLLKEYQTPPFEWYANFTFTNGVGGPQGKKDSLMAFATMEVPEFIGNYLFQRADGVETYFVDVNPPQRPGTNGPVTEVVLENAQAVSPAAEKLSLPPECTKVASADCNFKELEKCVLKATASTLLSGDTCAYMREMAFCFADNFCKEHLARLCSAQRAAKCRCKQCGFPAGGCPPSC